MSVHLRPLEFLLEQKIVVLERMRKGMVCMKVFSVPRLILLKIWIKRHPESSKRTSGNKLFS